MFSNQLWKSSDPVHWSQEIAWFCSNFKLVTGILDAKWVHSIGKHKSNLKSPENKIRNMIRCKKIGKIGNNRSPTRGNRNWEPKNVLGIMSTLMISSPKLYVVKKPLNLGNQKKIASFLFKEKSTHLCEMWPELNIFTCHNQQDSQLTELSFHGTTVSFLFNVIGHPWQQFTSSQSKCLQQVILQLD